MINGLAGVADRLMRNFYPPDMWRKGIEGQALLAYSVSSSGSPVQVEIVHSDDPEFSDAAKHLLGDMHFKVPPDWDAHQGPERLYWLEVQWVLYGRPPPEIWDPHAALVTITATPMPR